MEQSSPPQEFVSAIGGHPIVAGIAWRRGYTTVEAARAFLDPDRYCPAPAAELPGLAEAVARLQTAISARQPIRVWGDFDVDGQTSTSVLYLGLKALGADVDYTIPDRAAHSHGLNKPGIVRAAEQGVRVLLTCDCGVTDFEEIAEAHRLGMDVIVSDHHDLDAQGRLPDAVAIVNPKRLPEDHPLIHLPGVGVAYKLVEAMAGSPPPLLDLVALGIVADVAYQRGDTRYLLQRGLEQLRTAPRPGVLALLRASAIDPASLDAEDIGFQLGPRLNAVGRLAHAELCVELLTTADQAQADRLALDIERLNEQRKALQRQVEDSALEQIAADPALARQSVVVLANPDWHPSVIGVVASSISNRYGKPAVLIAARPGEIGRGSARSVAGIDIHAAIAAQGRLVETSGGHPMAAGFGIRYENVPAFRQGIGDFVASRERLAAPGGALPLEDAVVDWKDVSLDLCDQLDRLAPFGPGNPRPVLKAERLTAVRAEPLGKDRRHQALFLSDAAGHLARVLWWRSGDQLMPGEPCDLWFSLRRAVYRGKASMQIQVVRLGLAQADRLSPAAVRVGARFAIVDARAEADRPAALARFQAQFGAGNVQVWAESATAALPDCSVSRLQLGPMPVLVVWSLPPGPGELAAALERAAPQTVVLLTAAGPPEQDQPAHFLQQLAGMLKVGERRGESPDDPGVRTRMATRVGQREEAVRAGVTLLRAGDGANDEELRYLLDETRAYRHYCQAAQAEAVLRLDVD